MLTAVVTAMMALRWGIIVISIIVVVIFRV